MPEPNGIGPQSLILAYYGSALLHNLLPAGDALAWVSHAVAMAACAVGCVDVAVKGWQEKLGGTAPMVEQTGIIGVTEGIYNDMIAYSKTSDLMADEDFRKALGEAFIEIAQTDEGKEIISVFSQVGYTWGKDSDYDGERDAQAMLKSAGK